ncbi:hypothetical protein I5Q34_33705 [Streptomyces sp. AV19]|uniref:hypothetical protein n=1 Tax=Streptomyces sp. AV19 TaxID=2793068 RepID=UPI0018FE4D13|nr:hypothetical protein [Streptomyces sp. AV19]MBH1939158.1 hypothetical protein [Streptomyces sp. AV19]MDG4536832.1 hypothetical protein [Streptomyces sp. AV19]
MDSTTAITAAATGAALTAGVPGIALPESFSVEGATLGRQPNNDGDNSGAMFFE